MTVLLMKMNLRYEHPSPPVGNEPTNIHIELLSLETMKKLVIQQSTVTP